MLFKQKSIVPISCLSNKILCNLVAQGAAKLWLVKVGDQKEFKKVVDLDQIYLINHSHEPKISDVFQPSNLASHSLAAP